jgi:hypothetical protein
MPAAENGHQELIEHFLLADDDLADLLPQPLVGGAELLDQFQVVGLLRSRHEASSLKSREFSLHTHALWRGHRHKFLLRR